MNNYFKISDQLDNTIIEAFQTSIEHNQFDSIRKLENFVSTVLSKTYRKNFTIYRNFIDIPMLYYYYAFRKGNLEQIGDRTSTILTNHIRYLILVDLDNTKNIDLIKNINEFIYITYYGLSRLLFEIIKNRDIGSFEQYMENYRLISSYSNFTPVLGLRYSNTALSPTEEAKQTISVYHRRLKFGAMSWLYFLYDQGKIETSKIKEFLSLIKFKNPTGEELINDLLYYSTYSEEKFDWKRWDHEKRPEMQVYSPPQPHDWLLKGFAIFTLAHGLPQIFNENRIFNSENFLYLPDKLEAAMTEIIENQKKWLKILNPEQIKSLNEYPLASRKHSIIELFKKLKKRFENERNQEIISEKLSSQKIEEFKETVYSGFSENSLIRFCFLEYGDLKKVTETDGSFLEAGITSYFKRARMMFVEKNYSTILNTRAFGETLSDRLDNYFFKILTSSKGAVEVSDTISGIEYGIGYIERMKKTPSLIFIHSDYTYNRNLYENENFSRMNRDLFPHFIGTYKGIPIFDTFQKIFKNKILVSDFKNSFQLKELHAEKNYREILKITVDSIDDEEALKIYEEKKEEYKYYDGLKLTKEESLNLIKLNIKLDFSYLHQFEIKDRNSYFVGEISYKNN